VTTKEWLGGRVYGWADAVQPYTRSRQLFYCGLKDVKRPDNSTKPNVTDYYLNRNLSGHNASYIQNPASVLQVGEGNDGHDISNARYSRVDVPQSWATDSNSPLLRHKDEPGGYYLFLDGHVKSLEGTAVNFGFKRVAAKPKK
jgi:prepilin-type processing-associated H-X9-DG protein